MQVSTLVLVSLLRSPFHFVVSFSPDDAVVACTVFLCSPKVGIWAWVMVFCFLVDLLTGQYTMPLYHTTCVCIIRCFPPQSLCRMESSCLDLALEGERLCKAGDYRTGVSFFESAIQVGTEDLQILSAIYSQLGNAYFHQQEYAKALEYHRHDLTLTRYG